MILTTEGLGHPQKRRYVFCCIGLKVKTRKSGDFCTDRVWLLSCGCHRSPVRRNPTQICRFAHVRNILVTGAARARTMFDVQSFSESVLLGLRPILEPVFGLKPEERSDMLRGMS